MKLIFITLALIVLSSCAMQAMEEGAEATQLIHSKAGGLVGIFTGKIDSCTLITTEKDIKVKSIEFVDAGNTCKVILEK